MTSRPAAARAPRDPGRQPERTRLAWRRTVLTVTVVALLAARLGGTDPVSAARLLAAAGVLGVWLALLAVSWRRIAAMTATEPAPVGWAVPLTALATVGLGGLGLLLVAAG
ncbi:MAG: DUF202 domain-containing protein [Micromonosporaceae bacterium]|nr:DUF202 domain-containing protein [Micromonosporaceae bacterium]